jgi:hypothetical protein
MATRSPTFTPWGSPLPPPTWSMAPTFPDAMADRGSVPRTETSPSWGRWSPRTMEMAVDFPAPLGPRRARVSPRATSRSRWSRATSDR